MEMPHIWLAVLLTCIRRSLTVTLSIPRQSPLSFKNMTEQARYGPPYFTKSLKLMELLVYWQHDENEAWISFSLTLHECLLWQCTCRRMVHKATHLPRTMLSYHRSRKWGWGKSLLVRCAADQFWIRCLCLNKDMKEGPSEDNIISTCPVTISLWCKLAVSK